MTNGRRNLLIVLIAALVFAGAFAGTRAVRSDTGTASTAAPLARWLELDEETARTVAADDPKFGEELEALRRELYDARRKLTELFEAENVSDEALRSQVERVIVAHNRLERRVMEHIIKVRHDLTPAQRDKLMSLCADEVRKSQGRRWRGGRGAADSPASGSESDPSHRGRGRGWRGGRGGS